MNELKVVHEVRSTEVCEVSLTKNLRENQPRLEKVQENLENDSPWLLVFLWDERLHLVGSQVVIELVQMHEGLVWLSRIRSLLPRPTGDVNNT